MRIPLLGVAAAALLAVPAVPALADPSGTPSPTPTGPGPLSVVMTLGNDANGDGVYGSDETSPVGLAAVPFRFTLSNTDAFPIKVKGLMFTIVDGVIDVRPTPDPHGATVPPGTTATFSFTVAEFAPPDRGVVVSHLEVFLEDANDPAREGSVGAGSTVRTVVPVATQPPPGAPTGPAPGPGAGGGGQPAELPRTGDPLLLLILGGGLLVGAGAAALALGRPSRR